LERREIVGGALIPWWRRRSVWQKLTVRVAWVPFNEGSLKEGIYCGRTLTVDEFMLDYIFFSIFITTGRDVIAVSVITWIIVRFVERFEVILGL